MMTMFGNYIIDGRDYFLCGYDGRKKVYFIVEQNKEHNTISELSFEFDGVFYKNIVVSSVN